MKSLLTVEQLSQYLHKSVANIRSDVTRNPRSLPPICRLPNTKRLLWRLESVEHWLAAHVEGLSRPAVSVCADDLRYAEAILPKPEQIAWQRSQRRKQASAHPTEAAAEM